MPLYTDHPLEREDRLIKMTRLEVLRACYLGFMRVLGVKPTRMQLAIKCGHWAFETGDYQVGCHLFNLNNEKCKPDAHPHTYFACSERQPDGTFKKYKPPHIQTCFKAFDTIENGIAAAIAFLAIDTTPNNGRPNRYQAAWDALMAEETLTFTDELGEAGFYTDDPNHYFKGVDWCTKSLLKSGLVDQVIAELAEFEYAAPPPPAEPPTEQEHSPSTSEDIAIVWADMPVNWDEIEDIRVEDNLDFYERGT